MAPPARRAYVKSAQNRRKAAAVLFSALLVALGVVLFLKSGEIAGFPPPRRADGVVFSGDLPAGLDPKFSPKFPAQNALSLSLLQRNKLRPRNLELFPAPPADHVIIVLYVHRRPQYLKTVLDSLSRVDGIGETLLIVSHDGYFPEMDELVRTVTFCRVKQIFAPFSPHVFDGQFPGASPEDCRDKSDPSSRNCTGNADQYGNFRSPRIVSLKHHWWWMMNTVWNGLEETQGFNGFIVFIEEDHFIFPNAYRNLQRLTAALPWKCPQCYMANLAPSDVKSRGEGWDSLVAEKFGNVGYAFNRTVWRRIHAKAKEFCAFDDYNWDITMWAAVFPSFPSPVYSLRGSRRSAAHFGKCGLHQGQDKRNSQCTDNGEAGVEVDENDKKPNIDMEWPVRVIERQGGYQAGFKGWGGWADQRDRELCMSFAYMYHLPPATTTSMRLNR